MFWAASLATRAGKFQAFLQAFAPYCSMLKHYLPTLLQTGPEIREMLKTPRVPLCLCWAGCQIGDTSISVGGLFAAGSMLGGATAFHISPPADTEQERQTFPSQERSSLPSLTDILRTLQSLLHVGSWPWQDRSCLQAG